MEKKLVEKCGIFGAFVKGTEAIRVVYPGLWALQHRGQESSGITSTDGKTLYTHKASGLVAQVYTDHSLAKLTGNIAIGHNRYSTSGGSIDDHNQPCVHRDDAVALVHNGNLPSVVKLKDFFSKKKIPVHNHNDSELMHEAIRYFYKNGDSIEESVKKAFPLFTGVFCLLILTKDTLIAVRDEYGIRPLTIGKIEDGFVVSSETCAFSAVSAKFVRDVRPGEMVVFDKKGMRSYQLAKSKPRLDVFEFVYFARPDSIIMGQSVNQVRKNLGRSLAKEYTIKADIVIPVPDSAIPAALGYSEVSGIPFDQGFIKNRYIHRTFIRPYQEQRDRDAQMKLNPLPSVLKDKDVIVVDDSIVRGTTSKKIVSILRKAGAKKVHMVVSSPPIKYPDFYGIDTPNQEDLIGAYMSVEKIKRFIGADSLYYLSYKGLIQATGLPENKLSTSLFTGVYPVSIHERKKEVLFDL